MPTKQACMAYIAGMRRSGHGGHGQDAGTRNIAEVSTHDHACSMVAVAVGVTGQAARDIGDWWRTIVAEASETKKTWP